jgi:hypothetical protein
MTIWITSSETEHEVPLGSTYLSTGGAIGTETNVTAVKISSTGALCIGELYKGIVFRNKTEFKFLLEALENYVAEQENCYPLVLRLRKTGYVDVGIDETGLGCGYWEVDGDLYRFQHNTVPIQSSVVENPLLRKQSPKSGRVSKSESVPRISKKTEPDSKQESSI